MSTFDKQLPSDKDPPPKRRGTKDHLSVRIGSFFEASAGGSVAVILLALVTIIYLLSPVLGRLVP